MVGRIGRPPAIPVCIRRARTGRAEDFTMASTKVIRGEVSEWAGANSKNASRGTITVWPAGICSRRTHWRERRHRLKIIVRFDLNGNRVACVLSNHGKATT